MSKENPSITYLIASTGRDSLKDTLRSLYGQFGFGLDKIKLYFDGLENTNKFDDELALYGDDIEVVYLKDALGYWGHGIRNTYQHTCTTDYIHNMDDDDIYVAGCIPTIRHILRIHYGKNIIAKFRADGGRIIWNKKKLIFGEVGTPSGFIFNSSDSLGTWGYVYGGDFEFYNSILERVGKENLVFVDTLVVKTKPEIYGY